MIVYPLIQNLKSQCSKKGNILQILLLARFEPMTNSRRQESCAYNHLATKLIMKYECSFSSYTTAKFAHFRMAFLALGARKCKQYQSRLFLHIPIELLGPVVGRILANLTISKLYRQSKAKISIKNWIFSEFQKVSSYLHSGPEPQKQCIRSRYS